MNITDVRVRKVTKEGKMKAVVSITIDDEFVVHDIKVIEGEKGLFIAMPSRKATDGEYRDIAHPINSKTRSEIQEIILQKYEETLAAEEAETDEQPEAAGSPEAVPEEAPAAEAPEAEGTPEG
jgi:stage V sporulation protein G